MGVLGPRRYYEYIADNGQPFVAFLRRTNGIAGGAREVGRFTFPGLPRTIRPRAAIVQNDLGERRVVVITTLANPRWNIGLWVYDIDGKLWRVVEFRSERRTHA